MSHFLSRPWMLIAMIILYVTSVDSGLVHEDEKASRDSFQKSGTHPRAANYSLSETIGNILNHTRLLKDETKPHDVTEREVIRGQTHPTPRSLVPELTTLEPVTKRQPVGTTLSTKDLPRAWTTVNGRSVVMGSSGEEITTMPVPTTRHEEMVRNSTYDYEYVRRNKTRGEFDPTEFIRHGESRNDICKSCLCTRSLEEVSCEFTNYEDSHRSLILNKSIIHKEARHIKIRGYEMVTVMSKTFSSPGKNLSSITFEDIGNLILQTEAFELPKKAEGNLKLTLEFINCTISIFPTLAITQGIVEDHRNYHRIDLEQTPFLSVNIIRCHIQTIQKNALAKSRLLNLKISQTTIKEIERKGIDLNVVGRSFFKKNTFPQLKEEALCLHAKKVVFTENRFEEIGNHSILIETDSQVLFEFNRVNLLREEALRGIHPKSQYGASIVFHRNAVTEAEPRSLVIDPSYPLHERKVFNNSFQVECNCSINLFFHSILGTTPEEPDLGDSFLILLKRTRCLRPSSGEYVTASSFMELRCAPFPTLVVASVTVALVLFAVAVIVCVICMLRMQHMKGAVKSLGNCPSESFSTLNRQWREVGQEGPCEPPMSPGWIQLGGTAFPLAVAVPEFRTYQQNEVNEFTERTESIPGSVGSTMDLLNRKGLKPLNRASCPFN